MKQKEILELLKLISAEQLRINNKQANNNYLNSDDSEDDSDSD